MSGLLTTHILDATRGGPAVGVVIELRGEMEASKSVVVTRTNTLGRTDDPLLLGAAFRPGRYELRFNVGEYFALRGIVTCFQEVIIVISIRDTNMHYHFPLIVSPWGYSIYRGA